MIVKPFVSKRPRIEMVPLIDMFFLLLVFFIFGVFSMRMQQGLIVDLPSAHTAGSIFEESLTISVRRDGALYLNHQPLDLAQLAQALREHHAKDSGQMVVINADEMSTHGLVVTVLDAARSAGFQRFTFQTVLQPS